MELSSGIIDLVNAQTGKTLARLEDPNRDRPTWMGFTPDGTCVVTIASYSKAIHVWDLRRIRERLVGMDLDCALGSYPPLNDGDAVKPLHAQVDLGSLAPETQLQAVLRYSLAIAFMPINPEAYLRRGRAYFQVKQWREAADDLGVALALNPGHNEAQVWFELGYARAGSGRSKQALAAYTRSLELNPKWEGTWNNRGVLHEQLGELDKAVADLSRCIELRAKHQLALNSRARIYTKLGQWEKAVADYSQLIGLVKDPNQAGQLYLARAQAYVQAGRYREALADDQKLLELFPANAQVHNNLAWLLTTCPDVKLRDSTRAIQLAQQALRLGEQVGMVWNTLGVAQYRAGESKAAIESLGKSLALRDGGDAFDWFFLAMAHHRLSHKDEARTWYDRAAAWMDERQPKNEELRRFRAEAAELLGIKK